MFNCQIDALEQASLLLIPLFDVSADFLKRLFYFHVEVTNVSLLSNPKQKWKLPSGVVPKNFTAF
jgi:hypothetical protein